MLVSELRDIVKNDHKKRYRVKFKDGRKSKVVLLWSYCGEPAIINKGARNYGHYVQYYEIENWESVKLVEKRKVDYVKRMKKRATDALKMLNESGLWSTIKKEIEHFISDDEIIKQVIEDIENGSFYQQVWYGRHSSWCQSPQIFESFYSDKCWKSIAYPTYCNDKEHIKEDIAKSIKEHKNSSDRWVNGYDCSYEVRFEENGEARAWYSEEFRNCGNGHYYLLFDATHAIFYEDD